MSDTTNPDELDEQRRTIGEVIGNSRFVALVHAAGSSIRYLFRMGERYSRESGIYRWFTKDPDQDVVIIDLRETYSVGPLLRLIDHGRRWANHSMASIEPYWQTSKTQTVCTASRPLLDRIADTWVGRGIRFLFVPADSPTTNPKGERE